MKLLNYRSLIKDDDVEDFSDFDLDVDGYDMNQYLETTVLLNPALKNQIKSKFLQEFGNASSLESLKGDPF